MVVCKFFQQGRCKFGERCRDEHPRGNTAGSNSRNSFEPLQNTSGGSYGRNDRGSNDRIGEKYGLGKDAIRRDLTDERPQYILSAFGPGKDAPIQLFGGQLREQSFEELRVRYYELASNGRQREAVAEVEALEHDAKQQMSIVLKDLDGAIKYICNGENEHPNRIDVCKARGQQPAQMQSNQSSQPAFGQPSNNPTFGKPEPQSVFGRPSSNQTFGQPSGSSASGQPTISAFGQPSNPQTFGQPSGASTFGRPSTSTFGQPSAPVSAFSQATRSAPDRFATGTFGQPSVPATAFGQTPAFGRPTTSFGQTSTFGQPAVQAPVFGQPSSQSTAFTNHSGGATTFGQPSNKASVFGQPSSQPATFANPSSGTTTFGQPSNIAPAFGQPTVPSAFGESFGQPTNTTVANAPSMQTSVAPSNIFGTAAPTSTGSVFGRPSTTSQGPISQSSAQPQTTKSPLTTVTVIADSLPATQREVIVLPDNNVSVKDAQGILTSWKGKEVRRIDNNWYYRETGQEEWQRIWFPDGPPTFSKTEELPESAYEPGVKERYLHAMRTGSFGPEGIPLQAPRKEWCNWNI